MGDVCTDSPTRTIFSTSTSQGGAAISRSTIQSVSVGQGSVVTRSVQSGTEWIVTESSVGGSTETVQVEVPITISGEQQVFTVPISTLFAPCTSETSTSTTPTSTTPTSTSTPTSTTPTSTRPESTETSESRTTNTERTSRSSSPTSNQETQNTNTNPNPNPDPTPTSPSTPTNQGGNSASATGTLTTFSTYSPTTLPNGSQSTIVIYSTSSIAPSGGLNGDNNGGNGGKSKSNSTRAVAIGVGVTGGFIAFIILIFGITWHIRRKRKNAMPLDESEIWGPHHEAKTPPLASLTPINRGPGYTYNPYSEVRTTAYAPVPTMSPPRSRPIVMAESDDHRLSAGSYGPQPAAASLTAPLLGRAKTADEILYEAAREDLPKSRASSATASHHTRPSETGVSQGPHASFAASHKTHGSLASRTSGSAVGLLDPPSASSAHGSLHGDAQAAQRYQDLMNAPAEPERPTSPVSIAAPRLAIVNPDEDKDS
ncbi:hypothetical protein OPQ81_002465 [Rhizoctonia solani]|nr:hypothetical protein OPQ81_002465 [Rhizoctonia solani]